MKLEAESVINPDDQAIALLLELERLNAGVAVLRDCVASLAKERDSTAWRFETEPRQTDPRHAFPFRSDDVAGLRPWPLSHSF
jgi:hypothetical protein